MGASKFQPVKESDLSHHLINGDGKGKPQTKDKQPDNAKDQGQDADKSLDVKDYALHEALTLLKGINILAK